MEDADFVADSDEEEQEMLEDQALADQRREPAAASSQQGAQEEQEQKLEQVAVVTPERPTVEEQQETQDEEQEEADEEEEDAVLEVGTLVEVDSRTWPGINKLGGPGRIVRVHRETGADEQSEDIFYDVRYVLGGFEKHIESEYVHSSALLDRQSNRVPVERELYSDEYIDEPFRKKQEEAEKRREWAATHADRNGMAASHTRKRKRSHRAARAQPVSEKPGDSAPNGGEGAGRAKARKLDEDTFIFTNSTSTELEMSSRPLSGDGKSTRIAHTMQSPPVKQPSARRRRRHRISDSSDEESSYGDDNKGDNRNISPETPTRQEHAEVQSEGSFVDEDGMQARTDSRSTDHHRRRRRHKSSRRRYVGGYEHDGNDADRAFIQPEGDPADLPEDVARETGVRLKKTKNGLMVQLQETFAQQQRHMTDFHKEQASVNQKVVKMEQLPLPDFRSLYKKVYELDTFVTKILVNAGEDVMNKIIEEVNKKRGKAPAALEGLESRFDSWQIHWFLAICCLAKLWRVNGREDTLADARWAVVKDLLHPETRDFLPFQLSNPQPDYQQCADTYKQHVLKRIESFSKKWSPNKDIIEIILRQLWESDSSNVPDDILELPQLLKKFVSQCKELGNSTTQLTAFAETIIDDELDSTTALCKIIWIQYLKLEKRVHRRRFRSFILNVIPSTVDIMENSTVALPGQAAAKSTETNWIWDPKQRTRVEAQPVKPSPGRALHQPRTTPAAGKELIRTTVLLSFAVLDIWKPACEVLAAQALYALGSLLLEKNSTEFPVIFRGLNEKLVSAVKNRQANPVVTPGGTNAFKTRELEKHHRLRSAAMASLYQMRDLVRKLVESFCRSAGTMWCSYAAAPALHRHEMNQFRAKMMNPQTGIFVSFLEAYKLNFRRACDEIDQVNHNWHSFAELFLRRAGVSATSGRSYHQMDDTIKSFDKRLTGFTTMFRFTYQCMDAFLFYCGEMAIGETNLFFNAMELLFRQVNSAEYPQAIKRLEDERTLDQRSGVRDLNEELRKGFCKQAMTFVDSVQLFFARQKYPSLLHWFAQTSEIYQTFKSGWRASPLRTLLVNILDPDGPLGIHTYYPGDEGSNGSTLKVDLMRAVLNHANLNANMPNATRVEEDGVDSSIDCLSSYDFQLDELHPCLEWMVECLIKLVPAEQAVMSSISCVLLIELCGIVCEAILFNEHRPLPELVDLAEVVLSYLQAVYIALAKRTTAVMTPLFAVSVELPPLARLNVYHFASSSFRGITVKQEGNQETHGLVESYGINLARATTDLVAAITRVAQQCKTSSDERLRSFSTVSS
ncbi:hypothetical protein PRIC2_007830 [Phytophthora ramorum]